MASRKQGNIGKSHGQRVPPLIKVIINTLRNYPDGSQILKELIQNADDACATEVEFLLDESEHSTEHLIHPDVHQYQGPALYAWNNALFQEEDWEGIRDISVSRKEKKVLKVGRFALGFISVYHITDFPCILSNNDVLLLDPHMVIDQTGGLIIGLEDFVSDDRVAGHFNTFYNYFGYDGAAHYDGTIFRLPLRTGFYKTLLPNTIYTTEKVRNDLFGPFKLEIENCLLFMKCVHTVRVSVKDNNGTRLLYSVEVDGSFGGKLNLHRKEMFDFIENGFHLESSRIFISIFPTCFIDIDQNTTGHLWLVMNMLGLTDKVSTSQVGKSNPVCVDSYLPWLAIALPLPHSQHTVDALKDQNCWSHEFTDTVRFFKFINTCMPTIPLSCELLDFVGNLFCFLPIAATSKFPFHIHGYFALSTNRRSIKWPRFDDLSDEAKWNKELVWNLGTTLYAVLIHLMISRFHVEGSSRFHYRLWSCLPSNSEADELQRILHSGALDILQSTKLVFSEFNAAWIELSNGYYLPSLFGETISHEDVCRDMLLRLSQPLVDLTPEVAEVIKKYHPLRIKISNRIINPDLIRQMLIRFQNTKIVLDFLRNEQNVCSLLEIVLSDLVFSPQHLLHKLDGIRLIPVCDSDLPMFFGRDSYFISEGSQNLLTLFPGLDRNFVRPSLPHHISSSLLKLSRTGLINIQDISKIRDKPQIFVQLLERSMKTFFNLKSPIVWTPGVNNQPGNTWIEQLWKFISQEHNLITALRKNQMPILPKQSLDASEIDLLPLSTTPMPYLEECTISTYEQIERLIASSGCHICHRHVFILPFYNFVSPPIPQGFFSILKSQTIRRKFLQTISNAKDSLKQSLIKLILSAGLSNNEEINITMSFPIFKSMSDHWIALNSNQRYFLPPNTIPHDFNSYPQHFLNPFDHQNIELCWKVGVSTLSLDETIQHHLLPLIILNTLCNQERNQLSLWILRNYSLFNQNVISILATSKWLIDSSVNPRHSLKKPSLFSPAELFDPQDAILSYLMPPCTRGIFPNELYHEHINTLKLLGLVSSQRLDYPHLQNVVKIALQNTAFKNCGEFEIWMNALVDLINLHMDNLNLPNNVSFWNLFKKTAFIFSSSRNECSNYPKCLPFFAPTDKLFKPDEIIICSDRDSCLIAGVAPLLVDNSGTNRNYREIYRLMGFRTNISIQLVCQQLTVTTKQKDIDHSEIHPFMKKIYKHFARIIYSNKDLIKLKLPNKFVFIPKFGFYDCQYVVFSCDDALFPHIFSLEKYYPTYEENLAEFFKTNKIESEVGFSKCQFVLQRLQKSLLSPVEVNLAIKLIQLSADSVKNVATTKNCFMLAQDCRIHNSVQCVFNDLPWLKRSQILTDKPVVHSEISNLIADKFGCLPASSELTPTAESISYSFISGAGQKENLVKRLKNILEGYRAQSDVFLELIQNSDDAGAKQVKILFDYTTHPSTSVLHRNIEQIQGPALYLFNDSMFTDQDFESILELSSGNKLNDSTKIGRFGVGFNAVYNFTDCPSFVSSNLVQIFDPLRKYLGQITQDSGVRICFTDDKAAVSTYQDQFKVYHDIFNCNILNREPYKYTLFRLPFRLTPSKLSSQTFNNEEVARIQTNILKELPQLILFLQNITNIEVYEKKESGLPLKKLLTVSKSECSTTHFLQNNTKYFRTYLDLVERYDYTRPDNVIKSCDVVSICSKFPAGEVAQDFLISYASGIQECFDVLLRFNHSDRTFLPLCGVAIPLSYTQTPNDSRFNIYTFLPLPIRSPLLLHINGCFSLSSSRKNLSDFDKPESRGSSDLRTDWNLALINDALSNALIYALEVLPRLEPLSSSSQLENIFSYYSLWPAINNTNILWKKFPEFFVRRIVHFFPSTRLFSSAHDPSSWVSLDQISFLSLKENVSTKCEFIKFIFDLSYQHGIIFANFPSFFPSTVLYQVFTELKPKKVFDLKRICELVIFPNLGKLPLESIIIVFNSLIPLCNEESESWLLKLLCDIAFIPCGFNGKDFKLRIPSKVVCPNTKLTSLYKSEEMRIPVRELHDKFDFNKPDLLFINVLKRMGVIHSKLPECEVISRCDITSKLVTESAIKHATTLINYLSQEEDSVFNLVYPKIKSIPFIPTYKDSILDVLSIAHTRLVSPDRCYAFSCRHLISPLHSCFSENLRFYLSYKFSISSTPTLAVVLDVLRALIFKENLIREKSFNIDERILEIYKFISAEVKKESDVIQVIKAKIEGVPWIWHPDYKQFYISNQVVLSPEFRTLAKNKYLVSFPFTDSLRDENFKAFLINVGVKDKIDDIIITNCLEMIHGEFQDRSLQANLIPLVLMLIESIENCPACKNKIFILNQKNTLHRPDELYIQLSPHFEQEDCGKFVHSDINHFRALKLGAKTSEELFSKNTDFEESDFGVEEEITDRIQSLVRDIPKDALIKELIQNADDAEATEIVFIIDEQDYSSFDKTLSLPEKEYPNWKHLNTIPSLSVYNNKGFSGDDFKGIQTLSVGGKTQNRKSIGKFGVGFNSVYQITDTPTFLTSQPGSQGLTLCCIDPFIKYTVKMSETENSRKKRGKRFDIPSQNIGKFADQLHPFRYTEHRGNPKISQSLANLWENGEFTMFRFPLDINSRLEIGQKVPYSKGESRKPCSPKMVMDILSNHIKNSSEILLFLNHVQSLKVISIDRYGELKLEYSQSFHGLIEPIHQSIPDYFPLANIAKRVKIQEKECVNTHRSSTRVSKYRIYSFPDISIEQFVGGIPELHEFLGKYNEEKLWGCGGIAVCISPFECTVQSNIFTFLPFVKDKYPVHINAPLIFDASRQHFFTNQSSPWAEAWHSSIAKCILAPLYTLVVLDLQVPFKSVETVEDKQGYFDWFYHLFPDKSKTHPFLTKLSEEFYVFLYRTNQSILLCDNLDFSDELKWYPLHGDNCGVLKPTFFPFTSKMTQKISAVETKEYQFEVSTPYLESAQQTEMLNASAKGNKENDFRKSLILIQFPLSHAPARLFDCFNQHKLVRLDQSLLLNYLRDNIHSLFHENTYPCNINSSLLNFQQFRIILEYILSANEELFRDFPSIPLRIDIGDNIRCFRKDKPSYRHKYSLLMPHCSESFVSSKYDSSILHRLSRFGYVKDLNCDYLAKHLDVGRFEDKKQYSLFWEFLVQNKVSEEDLNKFCDHKLVPLISRQPSHFAFFPVNNLKFVVSETLNDPLKDKVLFTALKTLGCPFIFFDFFSQHIDNDISLITRIKSYLDKFVISQLRLPEIILGSVTFSSNLSAELGSEEAFKLYQIFSQMNPNQCTQEQLLILSQLKIFKTLAGDHLSLSQCEICFMYTETLILGPEILELLQTNYKLVIFQSSYSGDFFKSLCAHLNKVFVDVNELLLNYVLKHLYQIPFWEQKKILRFISHLTGGGSISQLQNLIDGLMGVPFIQIENCPFKVNELYSPKLDFVKIFLPDRALPENWDKKYLTQLFSVLGLRDEITLDDILIVALKFQRGELPTEHLPSLVQSLVSILSNPTLQFNQHGAHVLSQIGEVRFLPAWKIKNIITNQKTYSGLVRFCDAQLNEFQHCCSTTTFIHELAFEIPENFYKYMNMVQYPPPRLIKAHLLTVTNQVFHQYSLSEIPPSLHEFFYSSYEYLEKLSGQSNTRITYGEFLNLPCILVHSKLHYPVNMLFTSSEELKPFVLQLPPSLANLCPLFLENIGVEKKASHRHFAFILREIRAQLQVQNIELKDNIYLFQAEMVFNRLINDLRELEIHSTPLNLNLTDIVLLTNDSQLFPCVDVTFGDNPLLLSRINKLKLQFNILKPLEPDQNKSCVPPACLKLRRLTEFVSEEIDPNVYTNMIVPLGNRLSNRLQDIFNSPFVFRAMRRLYFHLTKKDLENILLKNGETCIADNQPHPGFLSVSQLFNNLNILCVRQIDILIRDFRRAQPYQLSNSSGAFIDANDKFLISNHPLKQSCIYKDISYAINAYLGNLFTEVLSFFELCFMLDPNELMDKLDEYNIAIDPWYVPQPPVTAMPANTLPAINVPNYPVPTFVPPAVPYAPAIPVPRPRPIPMLGQQDVAAAKLWFRVSQCDLFAAKRLISKNENDQHLFPAHACFCCFESIIKAFISLLHYRGSKDRLVFERNLRVYFDYLPFLFPSRPQIHSGIEQLAIPLINYDMETRIPSANCTPGMGSYIPQQIFTEVQAREAIRNATKLRELFMNEIPELRECILSEDNPILKCLPSPNPPLITAILSFNVGNYFRQIDLSPGNEEFFAVSRCFLASMPYSEIISIKKIYNPTSWDAFKQNIICETNIHPESCLYIRSLFHGSSGTHPDTIINDPEGFKMEFARRGLWGRGIYFAADCSYSHNYTHSTDNGLSCVFLATVFVGYAKELPQDRDIAGPPLLPNSTIYRYHSVRGTRPEGDVIHIVYKNCMAYPSFLITYRHL